MEVEDAAPSDIEEETYVLLAPDEKELKVGIRLNGMERGIWGKMVQFRSKLNVELTFSCVAGNRQSSWFCLCLPYPLPRNRCFDRRTDHRRRDRA